MLDKCGAPDQRLVRTIEFDSGTQAGTILSIAVEYIAPSTLNEAQQTEQRRFTQLDDAGAQQRLLQDVYHRVLASQVQKITVPRYPQEKKKAEGDETAAADGSPAPAATAAADAPPPKIEYGPVTFRVLATLVSLDIAAIERLGGLDAEVPLDTTDLSPIPDNKRDAWGCEKKDKTLADVARANILYLVNASARLRDWLAAVISDVSLFQDKDWEGQRKN